MAGAENVTKPPPPVFIPHLPKLPKDLSKNSHIEIERKICEVYLRFCSKNKEGGITVDDICGVHHAYEKWIREEVEKFCFAAHNKLRVAKRVATTPGIPDKQGLDILQKAAQGIDDAKRLEKAYNVASRLWEQVRARVQGLVAEQQKRETLAANRDKIGPMEHVLSHGPDWIETTLPGDVPQSPDRMPKFGVYEPLPRDALGPLPKTPVLPRTRADELYDATRKLCEHGQLCVAQLLQFPGAMHEERIALDKAMPSPERVEKLMAFNRIVRVWCFSFANDELESHKRWSLAHDSAVYDRPAAHYIPQEIRERLLTSEPVEDLLLAPRAPWSNPKIPEQLKGVGDLKMDAAQGGGLLMTFKDDLGRNIKLEGNGQVVMDFAKSFQESRKAAANFNPNNCSWLEDAVSAPSHNQSEALDVTQDSPSSSSSSSSADPLTPASGTDHSPADGIHIGDLTFTLQEEEEESVYQCIVCLERKATVVLESCRHLVYCRACQRKAVGSVLDGICSERTLTRKKLQQLTNNELDRTKIPCPVCRAVTRCVRRDRFKGEVYCV